MAAALSVGNEAILWPMLALVALTFAVAGRMYSRRVAELRARRISPQSIASRRASAEHLEDNRVMHRFVVFLLGMLCLLAMWVLFAMQLAG